jgi:hypothetical protein
MGYVKKPTHNIMRNLLVSVLSRSGPLLQANQELLVRLLPAVINMQWQQLPVHAQVRYSLIKR